MREFTPPKGLRNQHIQSILSSTGPRKFLEKRRATTLLTTAIEHVISTSEGFKLLAYLSKTTQQSKGLAIILHGWEGSADSLYMLSTGQRLLNDGYDVVRLTLRDHGDSQYLNEALFNFTCLQEVVDAISYLCNTFGGAHNVLCGYSLGGNFCLRVANLAQVQQVGIDQAIAICPLLHPPTTMDKLNNGLSIYEKYFVKKWKRSLFKKLQYHQHLDYGEALQSLTSLAQMNEFFVLGYTPFTTTNSYFEAYSILGDALQHIAIPTTIITSQDDPMIPVQQFEQLFSTPSLTIEVQQYGGHCAFIKNWKFESWASDRISALVSAENKLS